MGYARVNITPMLGIGVEIKKNEGWDLVLPYNMANGCEGYYPSKAAYEEGGYSVVI